RTSKVFFAKPGETGMTPVLDSFHNGMRFRPMGSDTASEHYLFFTFNSNSSLPGGELWSVPIDNPAAAVQLSVREDETQIGFDNEVLDAEESRVLFTSRELVDNPCCQPSMYTIWSAPLDGSTLPTVLGKLPRGRNPGTIRPVAESPWVYVFGAD